PEIWTLVVGIFVREGELADVVKVLRGFVEWNRVRLEQLGFKNEVRVGLTDELGRRLAGMVKRYEEGEGEELPDDLAVPDVVVRNDEGEEEVKQAMTSSETTAAERVARRRGKLGWVWGLVER